MLSYLDLIPLRLLLLLLLLLLLEAELVDTGLNLVLRVGDPPSSVEMLSEDDDDDPPRRVNRLNYLPEPLNGDEISSLSGSIS